MIDGRLQTLTLTTQLHPTELLKHTCVSSPITEGVCVCVRLLSALDKVQWLVSMSASWKCYKHTKKTSSLSYWYTFNALSSWALLNLLQYVILKGNYISYNKPGSEDNNIFNCLKQQGVERLFYVGFIYIC